MIKTRLFGTASRMLAVAALATVFQAAPAQAQQFLLGTFGQTGPIEATPFNFTGTSFTASTPGIFILNSPTNLPGSPNFVTGFLTLNGTVQAGGTQVSPANGIVTPITAATFSITSGANGTGTNFLTGTFTGTLQGQVGERSATILASMPPDAVAFTSSIFTIPLLPPQTLQFGLTGLTANLGVTAGNVNPFQAKISGQFTASVPEPATVALMGLGLAGIPVVRVLRRRKATV